LYINDVLPSQFEIKDWELKGANGKREDVTMTSEDGEGGLHIVWHVPVVEKGERLEVSFDIKGSGEVDAEALNRFHGVHFGDEIESDDLPTLEEAPAEEDGEATETEEDGDGAEESAPSIKFREDMLLRVMDAAGIDADHRDEFVAFAVDYDHDENGYLKKAELEDAAKAWNERNGESAEAEGDADVEEDAAEEAAAEAEPNGESDETPEAAGEEKACTICNTPNAADAATCSACGYTWE